MDLGEPISYLVLREGTPALSADGEPLGEVKRVLADTDKDLFDGLILETPDGDRFVDAAHVERLHERGAVLAIASAEASELPEPTPAPAVMGVQPDDVTGDTTGDRLRDTLRRAWDRISGNY